MKKGSLGFIIIISLLLVIGGCKGNGSIKKRNLNFVQISKEMDKKIESKEWNIDLLQDVKQDATSLQQYYGLTFQQVEAYMAKIAVLPYQGSEIAIFLAKDNQHEIILNQLKKRADTLLQQVEGFEKQQALLKDYYCDIIGDYVVFVTGNDKESVIQYIKSL